MSVSCKILAINLDISYTQFSFLKQEIELDNV